MISDRLDQDQFSKAFLKEYLNAGFGTMPKREIDLLVLRLIIEHTKGWSLRDPPNAFVLSQELRVKKSRIQSMLDELSYRQPLDESSVHEQLRSIFLKHEKDIDGNKVRVQISDGYLRDYLKNLVLSAYGIVDTSFDRSIIVLTAEKFLVVADRIADEKTRKKLEDTISKLAKEKLQDGQGKNSSLIRTFAEKFIESAGTETGKKAVDLGFAVLSGGLSEIPSLIKAVIGSS